MSSNSEKKTNVSAWVVIVLVLVVCGICGSLLSLFESDDQPARRTTTTVTPRPQSTPNATPRPPRSSWSTISFVDDWGERSGTGASSQQEGPAERMGFPYQDVRAKLMVSCRSAWIRFTSAPNLTGGDIRSGHDAYSLQIRLDGKTSRWQATQEWGATDISLPVSARRAWASANRFEVLLPWYGEGNVLFSWDLDGFSTAIAETCQD